MRQLLEGSAQLRIPQPDGGFRSSTGEQVASRRKSQTGGALRVPARPEQGTTFDVPKLDAVIKAPGGEHAFVRAEGERRHHLCMSLPDHLQGLAGSCHTRTSPRWLAAAQYCPLSLMATAGMASKVSVKTHSRSSAPARFASCISTPCRYTPRSDRCDRLRLCRSPRSRRSSASRFAGP